MQQGEKEQRRDDDASKERNDVGRLQQRRAEDFADQTVEHERFGTEVDGAHHGILRAVAKAIVEREERGAEGRSRDPQVSKNDEHAWDDQQDENGNRDDPARTERHRGENDVTERNPNGNPMSKREQGEEDARDNRRGHGDAPLGGGLHGAVDKIHTTGEQQQHQHLRQSAQ